jgi:3-phytase
LAALAPRWRRAKRRRHVDRAAGRIRHVAAAAAGAVLVSLGLARAAAERGGAGEAAAPAVVCRDGNARDQDDMAVWRHPSDPSKSTIIASDKGAGRIFVYDLQGRTLQAIEAPGAGNIDVRGGFALGGRRVDIVALNQRENGPGIAVHVVDPATRALRRADDGRIRTGENYGGALYRSPRTGKVYFLTTAISASCEQYELFDDGAGRVAGRKVRSWRIGTCEGAVGDDAAGKIYVAEEAKGVWEVGGEPEDPTPGRLVIRTGENGLTADVEGLAIHPNVGGASALVVSNQSCDNFKVYRLPGCGAPGRDANRAFEFLGTFAVEGARDTDGIDIAATNLGGPFTSGLFACHTDSDGRSVLLVPWDRVLGALAGPLERPAAKKTPGVVSAQHPSGPSGKRHLVSFSPRCARPPASFPFCCCSQAPAGVPGRGTAHRPWRGWQRHPTLPGSVVASSSPRGRRVHDRSGCKIHPPSVPPKGCPQRCEGAGRRQPGLPGNQSISEQRCGLARRCGHAPDESV